MKTKTTIIKDKNYQGNKPKPKPKYYQVELMTDFRYWGSNSPSILFRGFYKECREFLDKYSDNGRVDSLTFRANGIYVISEVK